MESYFEIQLLGPPQLRWQGRPFALPRRQARALLYKLAASRKPVAKESLSAVYWPETDDATARKNLSRLVSYLRQQLPRHDLLSVKKASIILNFDLVWCDAPAFMAMCDSDDLGTWESAIKLYHGPFLTGFALKNNLEYERWQSQNQRIFERLYLSTLSKIIMAMRQKGDYQTAIRYAEQYLETDDLSEEIHRELIALYALTGNRTAALKQYEICVAVLERELGVSPLHETYDALKPVLPSAAEKSRPSNAAISAPSWMIRPGLDLPLIGRDTAWQEMESAYQQMKTGGIILVSGEAGIGKSRLIQEFATRETRTVLTGNSHLNTQALPYYPLVQALQQALDNPERWANIPPIWLEEIEPILPELRAHFPDLSSGKAVDPDQAQPRMLEAIAQVIFRLALQPSPFLLCLDDLHWADDSTLSWLNYISPRLANSQLCIIGTYRWEEKERIQPVRRTFRRSNLLVEIVLSGLSTEAIGAVLEQIDSDMPDRTAFAARLQQRTSGNAFFLLETIRTMLESGSIAKASGTIPLPGSVQEAIFDHLAILTPLARQILDTTAVLFPDLDEGLLERTAGRTEFEIVDSLDELISRHILKEKTGALEFHHELLRTAVYQALTPWRRKLLHRRAGDALGEKYARNQGEVAAQMAFHYDSAMLYDLAVDYYEQAAQAAQAVYAYKEALQHLQRALIIIPNLEKQPVRLTRLYKRLGYNLDYLGRYEEARDALQQAIIYCKPEEEHTLARLHQQIAATHITQLNYREANSQLAKALSLLANQPAQPDDPWWKLWLDIKLDYLTLAAYIMDGESSQSLIKEIEPVIEQAGTEKQRRYFANRKIIARMVMERYQPSDETIAFTEAELELAKKSQNPLNVANAEFYIGFCLFFTDRLASAEKWLLKSLDSAREIDFRVCEARCLAFLSTLYRRQGDMVRTAQYAREAEAESKIVGSYHYQAHSLANQAWIASQNGQEVQATEKAVRACEYFVLAAVPFAWIGYMVLLATSLDAKRFEAAVGAARAMLDPYQQRLPDDLTSALSGAVQSWDEQVKDSVQTFLAQAVDLAKFGGYL